MYVVCAYTWVACEDFFRPRFESEASSETDVRRTAKWYQMFRCMLSVLILGSLVKISFGLVLKARPVQSLTSDARRNGTLGIGWW